MSPNRRQPETQADGLEAAFERALERSNTQFRELLDKRIDTLQRRFQESIEEDVKRLRRASVDLAEVSQALFGSGVLITERELSSIEAKASEAWVVTLDLYNDTEPGPIQDAVRANLKNGKRYTYFLPDPNTEEGRRAVERRIKHEREFSEFRNKITYIEFAGDVLFSSSEIVIHNPPPLFRFAEPRTGTAEAFTYARRQHPGSVYVRVDPAALDATIHILQRALSQRAVPSVAGAVLREYQERVGRDAAVILARWLRPGQPIEEEVLTMFADALAAAGDLKDWECDEILHRFRRFLPISAHATPEAGQAIGDERSRHGE